MDCEAVGGSSSKILNLPSNSCCKLEDVGNENLKDCLLKFVVLDFDRFSRSEFVAEVLVTLGELENLKEGVIICEELKLQQKVTVRTKLQFFTLTVCSKFTGSCKYVRGKGIAAGHFYLIRPLPQLFTCQS